MTRSYFPWNRSSCMINDIGGRHLEERYIPSANTGTHRSTANTVSTSNSGNTANMSNSRNAVVTPSKSYMPATPIISAMPNTCVMPEMTAKPNTGAMPDMAAKPNTGMMPNITTKPNTDIMPNMTAKPNTDIMPNMTAKLNMDMMPNMTAKPNMDMMPNMTAKPNMDMMPNMTVKPNMAIMPNMTAKPNMDMMPNMTAKPNISMMPNTVVKPNDNTEANTSGCGYKNGELPPCAPLSVGFVPFQQKNPPKYNTDEALTKGTLFPGLDLPFMNITNKTNPYAGTPMGELMALGFAIKEINLYLDTHPKDKDAFDTLKSLNKLMQDGQEKFVRMFGPQTIMDITSGDEYTWLNNPWPWDFKDSNNSKESWDKGASK
jgi:spore coat protein JB